MTVSNRCDEALALAANVSDLSLSHDLCPIDSGRRRKIKCNWTSNAATVCNECTKYSRECIAQGYIIDPARIDKSESLLKVKVKRMESMVERLAKIQNDQAVIARRDENGCSFERVQNSLVDGSELEEHASRASPLFRLFNNELVCITDACNYLLMSSRSRKAMKGLFRA